MDLGHHGLESQAGLQSNVRSGPNSGRRMPLNIKYEPRTRDSGRRAVQRLQKQVAPEHFSFISAASVRCSPFCNFRRRVNSDRLLDKQADARTRLKDAQEALEMKVAAKYGTLTEIEIKALVVDDKWLAQLATDVQSELDRVSQALTGRIRQLADRYAAPLPRLTGEVATLAARV